MRQFFTSSLSSENLFENYHCNKNGPLKDQTKTTTSNFFFKCYFLVFRQITLFSTNNVVSQFLSSKLEWSSCKNNFCSVFCKMYIPTHTLEKYVCINFQIYFKKLAVYYSFFNHASAKSIL